MSDQDSGSKPKVIAEDHSKNVQSAFTNKAARKGSAGNTAPFNACLATLSTIAIALQISVILPNSIGSFTALFIALFSFEWINVHFPSMTRARRACFDVANVLETYQPRARTHGHLFIPDPPTPAVTIAEGTENHERPKVKNEFMNARDAHYQNEFQRALQMAKEMELNAGKPLVDTTEASELVPAKPEEDKKESEKRAKKAREQYEAEKNKPFSC